MKYTKFPENNWGVKVIPNSKEAKDVARHFCSLKESGGGPGKWDGSGTFYYIKYGKQHCTNSTPVSDVIEFSYEEFREILDGPKEPIIINNYQIY